MCVYLQITAPGKWSVRQLIQPVALELHICEYRLRAVDTLALLSPHADAALVDGDTIVLEDATRVRDERGGQCFFSSSPYAVKLFVPIPINPSM